MITVVDRGNGSVIQKITKPNGEPLRYQVVPDGMAGDYEAITVASSLSAARAAIGKGPNGKSINHSA